MYLGLEGVIFAKCDSIRHSRIELANQRLEPLPLLQTLAAIVSDQAELAIVLNSWLIADYSYRSILDYLPKEISLRTIGATMQGNRAHRRRVTLPRVEILRGDISRRQPTHFVIVESAPSAIPYEHLEQSVIVEGLTAEAQAKAAESIARLLSVNAGEPYSDGDSRQERPPPSSTNLPRVGMQRHG
ncbi:HAD domain-containing protein [Paraburkholderia tropica]|uniref:HAD domain-containing protein n=1 Tax=Paraburkholderia tropica TaxID=92647 RepID=UPI002AB00884|nr:HAD domain-containing protein [Paraburkholderia tropica]